MNMQYINIFHDNIVFIVITPSTIIIDLVMFVYPNQTVIGQMIMIILDSNSMINYYLMG